jgi:Mg2+/Co2+ transporter CorB
MSCFSLNNANESWFCRSSTSGRLVANTVDLPSASRILIFLDLVTNIQSRLDTASSQLVRLINIKVELSDSSMASSPEFSGLKLLTLNGAKV